MANEKNTNDAKTAAESPKAKERAPIAGESPKEEAVVAVGAPPAPKGPVTHGNATVDPTSAGADQAVAAVAATGGMPTTPEPPRAGVHGCVTRLDAALRKKGSRLPLPEFSIDDNDRADTFYIATEKGAKEDTEGMRRSAPLIAAKHCPMCGDRL